MNRVAQLDLGDARQVGGKGKMVQVQTAVCGWNCMVLVVFVHVSLVSREVCSLACSGFDSASLSFSLLGLEDPTT